MRVERCNVYVRCKTTTKHVQYSNTKIDNKLSTVVYSIRSTVIRHNHLCRNVTSSRGLRHMTSNYAIIKWYDPISTVHEKEGQRVEERTDERERLSKDGQPSKRTGV